jgi:hypothetical protein
MAPNWEIAVELHRLLESAPVDAGVSRKAVEGAGAVVGALLVQQEMDVNQPAGLVVGQQPGAAISRRPLNTTARAARLSSA